MNRSSVAYSIFLVSSLGLTPVFANEIDVETPKVSLEQVQDNLKSIQDRLESRSIKIRTKSWAWDELEGFQAKMWRAMALDPTGENSTGEIPAELDPARLTKELRDGLAKLMASRHLAEKYHSEQVFDDYVGLCDKIIQMREERLFRRARFIAKKGVVEEKYLALVNELATNAKSQLELAVSWDKSDRQAILDGFQKVRADFKQIKHDAAAMRDPASMPLLERSGSLQSLIWVLMPLLFLTGFAGGMLWKSHPSEGKHAEEQVEDIKV